MTRIFLHLKKYGSSYFSIIVVACISALIFCMFNSPELWGYNTLDISVVVFGFFLLPYTIFVFFRLVLLEKEKEMVKYLQSKSSSLADKSINEIQDSLTELDSKDYIALKKEYLAYKKRAKRLEKIEIKRLAKLREQERNQELELEKQKNREIKNLILHYIKG